MDQPGTSAPSRRFVHVTSRAEGLHHWPGAPEQHDYLRAPHRHEFVAQLQVEVTHHDREIEINELARWLGLLWPNLAEQVRQTDAGPLLDFGAQSCETLAERIGHHVHRWYGATRTVTCTILEDGIQGAGATLSPETST